MFQLGTQRALLPLQPLQSHSRGTAGARHGLGAATAAPGATPAPRKAVPGARGQLKKLQEHFKLPSVAAELSRHRAGALPGKCKPHHALLWDERGANTQKGTSPGPRARVQLLCFGESSSVTPKELSGLKSLLLQKPLLTASRTCFKGPKSPEISHKKLNPQSQHSQNGATQSRQSSRGLGVVMWGNPGFSSHSRNSA